MSYSKMIAAAIFVAVSCVGLQGQTAISAEELARHLGVVYWRVPKALLPSSGKVVLAVIEKGKVTEVLISLSFKARSDLLVCASEKEGRPYFSCSVGGVVAQKPVFHNWNLFLGKILALPENPIPGTYILSGSTVDPKHVLRSTDSIEAVDAGLAMAIVIQ
jgi:hypothetical protein